MTRPNRTLRRTTQRVAGPPRGVVEVWSLVLAPPPVPFTALTSPLDEAEWAQAGRLRVGGEAWAAARGALRLVLARYLGCDARELRFRDGPDGKPELDRDEAPRFSLSHTDGLVVIAIASDREVGVDVERENEATDIERLSEEFLPASDMTMVRLAAPEARRKAFFAAWTRHEARLKLRGQGLAGAPAEFAVGPGGLVLVRAVKTPEGYAAAVAAEGGSWTVLQREITELL